MDNMRLQKHGFQGYGLGGHRIGVTRKPCHFKTTKQPREGVRTHRVTTATSKIVLAVA
jgi:hypothetical protein